MAQYMLGPEGDEDDDHLMQHWSPNERSRVQSLVIARQYEPSDTTLPSYCYSLEESKSTYQSVAGLVSNTWRSDVVGRGRDARGLAKLQYDSIEVKRIWNVNNRGTLASYGKQLRLIRNAANKLQGVKTAGAALDSRLHKPKNEFFLFHGTQEKSIVPIVSKGFHCSGNGLFGPGVYFADSATKSDQYTDDENKRSKSGQPLYMIVARVTLGNVYLMDDSHARLPSQDALLSSGYDSIVATRKPTDSNEPKQPDPLLFREFVVFNQAQCYPEFLVEYKRCCY